jgi:hypothetical protein
VFTGPLPVEVATEVPGSVPVPVLVESVAPVPVEATSLPPDEASPPLPPLPEEASGSV